MKAIVNSIAGIDDAIVSMFISKHTLTPELENDIRTVVAEINTRQGKYNPLGLTSNTISKYADWMDKLTRWGKRHITMLRFIDFSCTVYGLHRAGQDDWDAHCCRFNNRIIRNSSRIGGIKDESKLQNMSDYYSDKVLTTDAALDILGQKLPERLEYNGEVYVRSFNGYIVEGQENIPDVKRGLYNLGFPSDFLFRCNITEYAHVYKERNEKGGANPEVKQCAEMIADQLEEFQPWITKELLLDIQN